MTARTELWDVAVEQHGYFTLVDAKTLGLDDMTVRMMARRQHLEHAARGVWRFPSLPATPADPYQLAVLWTGAPEAALSHETALAVRELGDVNPDRIHVTVGKLRRIRRARPGPYAVHCEDVAAADLGWWEGIRTVSAAKAIAQCIELGTPTHLLRQALEEGRRTGALTTAQGGALNHKLETRHGKS